MARPPAAALLVVVVLAIGGARQLPPPVGPLEATPSFDTWLADLRAEALSRGIRAEIVHSALSDVQPVRQILERDQTQAEFTLDLDAYLKRRLTRDTVRTARQMFTKHRQLLERVGRHYHVQPRILVAIWGLESNFGRFAGVRPTIPTLATLAYDPRRATLFRSELFSALEILDRGDIELERLRGSWAGALGQPQFMPSSYLRFAQDFDGDGRRDIWSSHADVFASIAFYLQEHGWAQGQVWGREVRVAPGALDKIDDVALRTEGCRARRSMTVPRPLAEWSRLGVRAAAGGRLPAADLDASLFPAGSRYFLAYRNYEALLDYNCTHSYALSIGLLARQIP